MKPLCEKVTVCDPRGVDSAYETGGDARRLAYCNYIIIVMQIKLMLLLA